MQISMLCTGNCTTGVHFIYFFILTAKIYYRFKKTAQILNTFVKNPIPGSNIYFCGRESSDCSMSCSVRCKWPNTQHFPKVFVTCLTARMDLEDWLLLRFPPRSIRIVFSDRLFVSYWWKSRDKWFHGGDKMLLCNFKLWITDSGHDLFSRHFRALPYFREQCSSTNV